MRDNEVMGNRNNNPSGLNGNLRLTAAQEARKALTATAPPAAIRITGISRKVAIIAGADRNLGWATATLIANTLNKSDRLTATARYRHGGWQVKTTTYA